MKISEKESKEVTQVSQGDRATQRRPALRKCARRRERGNSKTRKELGLAWVRVRVMNRRRVGVGV